MKKNKKRKIIKWTCLIIWMILIFMLSNQANSWSKTHKLISNAFYSVDGQSNLIIIDTLNVIIRKLGHITEYLILSLLFISLLKEYTNKNKMIIITCAIFSFLYACIDEFHQTFIIGRSGVFTDVLIDSIGIIISITIYSIISYNKRKKPINKHLSN